MKHLIRQPWVSAGLVGGTAIKIKSLPTESCAFLKMIFGEEPPFSRVFVSPIYRLVVSMTSCWYGTGSQKKVAYGALQRMAQQEALARAREEFGRDLIAGRLGNYRLMDDVVDLFQFLELGWPADGVFDAVG